MATVYKVLGQTSPAANTLTTLYSDDAAQSVVSTLSICNTGVGATYRIAVRPGGENLDPKHYIAYDVPIPAYTPDFLTIGLTLAPTDVVSVYASSATVSFSLFGSQIS